MRNKIYLPVFIILSVLFIESCKVGPNYQKVEVPVEESYRFNQATADTDTIINLRWWELFRDPQLDTLIRIALEENKDIDIAAARVEEARAKLGFTKADMWPKLDYSGQYQYGNFAGGFKFDDPAQNIFAGATLNWELDFWGKYRRANESERARLLASEYGLRSVQLSLISTVAQSYFQLLDFRMRLEISKLTAEMRDSSLYIIRKRFERGIIPEIDVNQSEINLAIAASAVPFYERAVAQTENAISVLLGINPGAITVGRNILDEPLPDTIPTGIPSIILERRPDILQAEQNLIARNALVGVAVAQRFPSISLTGVLGVASTEFSSLFTGGAAWAVGGNLLGPLFHFNKNKRRVDIERARTKEAVAVYERTVLNAFREVEDALVAIETYKRELVQRNNQMKAALNARDLSAQRYDKGVTSYLEVLETQRLAFDAELLYSENLQLLFNSYINLYNALGGGWLSEAEEQEAAQKAAEEAAQQGK